MKTKLDYYRVFYEVARYGSFSLAAEKLYISQSAISQCVQQLEKDLNTQLFVRSRKGVTLTKEGKMIFPKIESAILAIDESETLLQQLLHLHSGSLVIAAGDTITSHFLLPYLEAFHIKYPNIKIETSNSYSKNLLQYVKEGKAELAFVNMPAYDNELNIEPCMEIHDVFVCGPEYDLKKSYTWKEMAQEPLILLEQNSTSRRFLEEQFKNKNIELYPKIEIAVHDLLIKFASIHLGVSCVVEEFSKESISEGTVRPMNLNPPLPPRSIGCAYLKHKPLSLPAREFLKIIKSEQKNAD